MQNTRYNSLLNRSYDLLLRYKLYEYYKDDKTIFDDEDLNVSDITKLEFSKLYIKGMRSTLKAVNEHRQKVIEEKSNSEALKNYKENYKNYFKQRMSLEDFEHFWAADDRSCGYCGLSEKQIVELYENNEIKTKRFYSRGATMEIDKIVANGEYEIKNIILSCYWCNNAKTDEFTLSEFKKVAEGINAVWAKRLGIKIKFPKETYCGGVLKM